MLIIGTFFLRTESQLILKSRCVQPKRLLDAGFIFKFDNVETSTYIILSMNKKKHIILFDGECTFCSFWVKFVLKRDKHDQFRFASLQSMAGIYYQDKHDINDKVDSVVLIHKDGNCFH